jgi:hypothetical protein
MYHTVRLQIDVKKLNLSLQQTIETHRVVGHRSSQIFYTIGSQMVVRLSALSAGRPLPPRRFLLLIILRGLVDSRAVVWLEGLGQFKNSVTSGIKPVTFRLVA